MINAKVNLIMDSNHYEFRKNLQTFLETIDIRQIVKTEFSTCCASNGSTHFSILIYYVGIDDIRDAKIDNILEIK